jgi:starch phosphorylase
MSQSTRTNHPLNKTLPTVISGIDTLAELALDLRWSWNHATDEVWRQLDSELWERTQNPWVVLQTVSRDQIDRVLADPVFHTKIDKLLRTKRAEANRPAWFQNTHPQSPLACVAYFSMEFMLSEGLPIYSGGLGNVAGDQLKAASDLGVPVVGVGLLYQQGYFRQVIDENGAQQALYPFNDPGQLPITPLRKADGEWLRLKIKLPGYSIWLRAWEVQVGRTKLYLLDSNDPENFPSHRCITSELYGGGPELRLKQEMVLGIGGWRLLAALGIEPEVCHLNEGHAAFAVLERARSFMRTHRVSFEAALATTRAGNHFTTHTAVAAGFDRFSPALVEKYLGAFAQEKLGISTNDLLAFGRKNADDTTEDFNMAYLAIRGCGSVNGVSKLHGEVSRNLFSPLFPRWPVDEVPISYVTNGVHTPTWDSAAAHDLWTQACGEDRWLGTTEKLESAIEMVPDETLWKFRLTTSKSLVEYARERLARQYAATSAATETVKNTEDLFNPKALTLGFARRFATYKRPDLLLHDPERLLRLLSNPELPVQLMIAGKAHPADAAGQALIQKWIQFIRRPEVRPHAIFLSDHDMELTKRLVQGVDVWINSPRRPWEACGTSGMKVLVNGGINISELDGWWAEAYMPDLGWAIGDGKEHGNDPDWDAAEAEMLYDQLENEVIPEFYDRSETGIPTRWVARMRKSMARLTPQYSANRAVREYTEKHYLPAAKAYSSRCDHTEVNAEETVDWSHALTQNWHTLSLGNVNVTTSAEEHRYDAEIFIGDLEENTIHVELYADGIESGSPVRKQMQRVRRLRNQKGGYGYRTTVSAARPSTDYTVRLIPYRGSMAIPLEDAHILWQSQPTKSQHTRH